jgi:cysteinyl-tRNA synthetase
MLRFYDTAKRAKVDFVPRVEGHVSMYVCGATPYSAAHLGHGRKEVVFDAIRRYLLWRGFAVTYVSNVTDIEDKIIARAAEAGTSESELVRTFEVDFARAFDRLNIQKPDEEPRATEWIAEMIALIVELIDRGHAYVVEGQGVYFAVESLAEYGGLSHRSVADLLESAGARVDVDEKKRSPVDFALWKTAKPGEPSWDSPWGMGRPGWHIECSAMALKILGDGFDIHGGGDDLVFPHHENEIAQAIGAGREFARYWLHNGMVNVDGEKMSKSLGNWTTLNDVLDRHDPRAFRMVVLQTHYRRQMELGDKELADAAKAVARLDALVRRARVEKVDVVDVTTELDDFRAVMDDDFDTPAAIALIFEWVRDANTALDGGDATLAGALIGKVRAATDVLGVVLDDSEPAADDEIAQLVQQRNDARAAKDWAEADRMRDEISARGFVIEDTANGTTWRRRRPDEEG